MSLFISTYLVVFGRAILTRAGSFYSGQNCTACTYVTDGHTDYPFVTGAGYDSQNYQRNLESRLGQTANLRFKLTTSQISKKK